MKRKSAVRSLTALSWLALLASLSVSRHAAAEETLSKPEKPDEGWEFFSDGRIQTFFSWTVGDGTPPPTTNDLVTGMPRHQVLPTGGTGATDQSSYFVTRPDGTLSNVQVNHINSMRVRSGFTGNVIGVGVRRNLNPQTKVTGYISITSIVDSQSQKKYFQSVPDVREGYMMIQGPWGSFLAGRTAVLFNRGAVQADFRYLHGYGLGFPGDLVSAGGFPTAGQIGFGVLANGFAAGFVYSTPTIAGLQLNAGLYDPASLTGSTIERTKFLRPEFELTADEPLGTICKTHVYLNGGFQPNYQQSKTDDTKQNLYGLGYGARVELGPVHLAGGGHWGKGLGLAYPGLPSDAVYDSQSKLRETDGYYVMAQLALGGRVDINAGFGQTRIKLTTADRTADPLNAFGDPAQSVIKSQTGISGAVVLHAAKWLHFDVDVMHTDAKWSLGERQQDMFYNAGTTINW